MSFRTLIFRSLRFHTRAHLGVLIGAAIASAVLTGALLVGDSMRGSLRERALGGLGWVHFALAPHDRFVSPDVIASPPGRMSAAALLLPGTISREDGSARANKINVFGVDARFWKSDGRNSEISPGNAIINRALAEQLHVGTGDEVLLRCRKPPAMSREIAVTTHQEETAALRLRIVGVTDPQSMGDFSLRTAPTPPLNAFVRFDELNANVGMQDKANLVLAGGSESIQSLNDSLRQVHSIEAFGFELRTVSNQNALELRSRQIFLEPELVRAASAIDKDATNRTEILTFLANVIRAGTNSTPYSMVTAAGPSYTPASLKDDEIVLSQWLADDLHAGPGTELSLVSFDPESGAALVERTNLFRVRSIVPPELPWADRALMPDFPGIEKAESTSDWDAGFPLTYKIRPKDEEYWKKQKGTPKAFITLAAGQKIWGNRFGNLTAIRFAIPIGKSPAEYHDLLNRKILANLNPEALGLRFEPIREQALKGAAQSQDFGQLFLGFSLFLVVAALLLMALLFQLGLERRAAEAGMFLALGFQPKRVRRLYLLEGIALALLGSILGAFGGAAYARFMLKGLSTVWRDAVGAVPLHFFASPASVATGIVASVLAAALALWLSLRKLGKQPARELLAGPIGEDRIGAEGKGRGWLRWAFFGSALSAIAILGLSRVSAAINPKSAISASNPEVFFSAGCLLLIAGLTGAALWFRSLSRPRTAESGSLNLSTLAIRGAARRRKRSLATLALLATGAFLIVSIGVFRLDANQDALKRESGTGGFALIGESTLPIVQDLNTTKGREAFALDPTILQDAHFVQFRVHDGDEASCLNLDRAQKPRLLGVNPDFLRGRFTFTSMAKLKTSHPWDLLKRGPADPPDEVPAIADANSLEWALHKKVGETIDYTDEQGRPFKLRLVGAVANSILQGSLIIDEAEFIKRFPGEMGYRLFLIETPADRTTEISGHLSRALQDTGLELTSSAKRLNAFNAVQNTYLGTFQILGGLGLLLGSAGLAIVVLRNMLERRGEMGLLTAVGFNRPSLERMTLIEHGSLLLAGLGIGIISALAAVIPALLTPGRSLPYLSLTVTLAAIFANGLLWTWLSTRIALRGNLLQSLRNE